MNQRDAILTLFEATADLPETKHLRQARRWAEQRLEVLRRRYRRAHLRKLFKVPSLTRRLAGGDERRPKSPRHRL